MNSRSWGRGLLALVLCTALAASQVGCGGPSLGQLQTASSVAAFAFAEAPGLVQDLARQNFLSADEERRAGDALGSLRDVYRPFDAFFQNVTDLKSAESRARLAELFADFTAELDRLNAGKLLFVKNPVANARLGALLSQASRVARLVGAVVDKVKKLRAPDESAVKEIEAGVIELNRLATAPVSQLEVGAQRDAE